jgi:two-component system, OmpR family, clock-associated histidine kinase SasA
MVTIASPSNFDRAEIPLQLLLFVDRRPSSWEQLRRVRQYLQDIQCGFGYDLEAIDVEEKPYLAEHFKLVATPALVKIHPHPQETIAGSDLVAQLERYWMRWQRSVEEYLKHFHFPSEEADGEPTTTARGFVATSTRVIQLSDEIFRLKQENEELKEQLRFKERSISILAHELRNPLTAASIAIETLESLGNFYANRNPAENAKPIPIQYEQLIAHARTQTRIIERMIADMLGASQGEGKLRIQPKQLDLRRLCLDALKQQQKRIQAKAQEVKTDIPNDLPYAYADGERIRQVLINLLDNAVKYTPKGGTIGISMLHRTSQKLQISVRDTGPGVPSDQQIRIFEEQVRLERDEEEEGYGIGLALCQRIVRAHYGQIWVDSSDRGSCFHFTLPVYVP